MFSTSGPRPHVCNLKTLSLLTTLLVSRILSKTWSSDILRVLVTGLLLEEPHNEQGYLRNVKYVNVSVLMCVCSYGNLDLESEGYMDQDLLSKLGSRIDSVLAHGIWTGHFRVGQWEYLRQFRNKGITTVTGTAHPSKGRFYGFLLTARVNHRRHRSPVDDCCKQ